MVESLRSRLKPRDYFKLTVVDKIEGTDTEFDVTSVEASTEDGVRAALGDRLSDLTMDNGMKISERAVVYIESGRKIGRFYINIVDHGSHPLTGIPPQR